MTDYNSMYRAGKKMEAELNGYARGGKVAIKKVAKPHVPAAKVNVPKPRVPSPRPPVVTPMPPQGVPLADSAPGFKAGGKIKVKAHVRNFAKGGKVSPIKINPANKGKLRAELGVAKDKPIPAKTLEKAKKSAGPAEKKRIVFAENAKKFKHAKGGKVQSGREC